MKLVALLLFPLSLQALAVTATSAVPTQAALAYTAPSGAACTVEVSESNTYSPLVHDVDTTMFTGSNLDSRPGSLNAGTARVFVVGTRVVQDTIQVAHATIQAPGGGILYTAVSLGAPGNLITVTYIVSGVSTPFSGPTVTGNAISLTLATNSIGAPTSTYSDIVTAVNASGPASALVTATVIAGGTNIANAGQWQLQDGTLRVSRALQQGTTHYYRVTCAGPTIATGSFVTKTLPFGVTYQDLMPMMPDGSYNYPSTPNARNYKIVDSQTGVLLSKVNTNGDFDVGDGYNPPWTSSGGFGAFCADTISGQGNHHCAVPGFSANGNYLYAINPGTGDSSFLGIAQGNRHDLDPAAGGTFGTVGDSGETTNWAMSSPTAIYTAVNLFGRNTIARWSYTGADVPVAPSIPPATAAGTSVDMLGGQDLNDLARAFNSHIGDYDLVGTATTTGPSGSCAGPQYNVTFSTGSHFVEGPSLVGSDIQINGVYYRVCTVPTNTTMTVGDFYGLVPAANPTPVAFRWRLFNCGLVGSQANYGIIKCPTGAQNSMTWEGTFAFGNGIPLGTGGSTAHWQGLVNAWGQPGGARWTGNHSWEFLGESQPIMSWATSGIISEITGGGPYDVVLGTNLSAEAVTIPPAQTVDTNITITSASLINTHNSVCTDNWSAPAGWVDGYPLSYCYPHFLQSLEVGDVLAFISGGLVTEFIQIKVKHSPTSYDIIRGTQSQFTTVPAHTAGVTIRLYPAGEGFIYNLVQEFGWGYVFWDFVNSPNGNEHVGDFVLNWGSHPSTRLNVRTEYLFDNNASPTNKPEWGVAPPYTTPVESVFGGVRAPGSGNFFQKHPSLASGNVNAMFDVWYLVGGGVSSITPVMPYTHVWQTQAVGPSISPKVHPIFSKTYGRSLVDVSSPTKVLTDADDYVFCIARVAGECAMGSSVGGVYFSDSNLDPIGGGQCTGGENPSGLHDICIANWNALGSGAISAKVVAPNDLTGAQSMRALSRVFSNWEMATNSSGNLKLTYPGDWALWWRFPTAPSYSPFISEVWALKVPADPGSDGIDRGQFVPATLNLTPPPGIGIAKAQVKFWYNEQGGTISNPYCTGRREGCVAVKPAINLTASNTCASVTNTCTVTVTSLGIPGSTFDVTENPTTCSVGGVPVGFTVFSVTGSNPINTVTLAYPAQAGVTCTAWGAPFSYLLTDTVTPAACSSSCTIQLPIAPLHTAYFSVEYLDSGNTLVTSRQGLAMENTIINLGVQTGSAYQGTLSGTFR